MCLGVLPPAVKHFFRLFLFFRKKRRLFPQSRPGGRKKAPSFARTARKNAVFPGPCSSAPLSGGRMKQRGRGNTARKAPGILKAANALRTRRQGGAQAEKTPLPGLHRSVPHRKGGLAGPAGHADAARRTRRKSGRARRPCAAPALRRGCTSLCRASGSGRAPPMSARVKRRISRPSAARTARRLRAACAEGSCR